MLGGDEGVPIKKVSQMSKKIIVLNGSPRKNGNTSALIDRFTEGARSSGHTVSRFDIQQMNMHPCIGCLKGGKDPNSPCTQKDDMEKVYPVFKEADIIVLASPLYCWSFSAQLKAAIDRLFAVMEEYGRTPEKDCMMIIAAEGNDDENIAPMISYYETLAKFLNWTDIGQLVAGGVLEIGDISGHPALDEAYKIGAGIE